MKPYVLDLTKEEALARLERIRKRGIQSYQPYHLFPDFVTPHKKEGFKRRIAAIHKAVGDPTGKRFLDLGCAVGWILYEFVFKGGTGIGVDISENNIRTATSLAKQYEVEDKVEFYVANVYDYIMELDDHFDYIMVLNLLNHIIDQKGYEEGWEWLNVISTKCDRMICNHYSGVNQIPENIVKFTTFNKCEVIMQGDPYYNNMGRPLYEALRT